MTGRATAAAAAAVALAIAAPVDDGRAWAADCAPESPPHRETVARLAAVDRALQAGAGDAEGAAALESLLAGDCLRGAGQALGLGGARGDALRTWWTGGGARWLRAELWWDGGTRQVLFPPDLRVPFMPPPGPLGPLLTCADKLGCAFGDADRFLDETVTEVAAQFESLTGDAARPERHAADCGETVHAATPPDPYAAWWACVQRFRPRQPALPTGTFALPGNGVVRIAASTRSEVGKPKRCEQIQVYDLANGAALAASRCDGQPVHATAGFVEPRRARELTLLAAVGGQLGLRRPAATVTLPQNIARTPESAPRAEATPPLLPIVRDGRAVEVKLAWRAVGTQGPKATSFDHTADGAHFNPVAFDLERRVTALGALIRPGCPPLQPPAPERGPGVLERAIAAARRDACATPARPAPR